jgi:hypothetical protein
MVKGGAMKYKSKKAYTVIGAGPGKVYPRITFPREMSPHILGKTYGIELGDNGVITLLPQKKKKK